LTHRHPAHFTYTPVMPVELVRDGLSREKLRHTIIQQHRKNTTKVILPPFEPLRHIASTEEMVAHQRPWRHTMFILYSGRSRVLTNSNSNSNSTKARKPMPRAEVYEHARTSTQSHRLVRRKGARSSPNWPYGASMLAHSASAINLASSRRSSEIADHPANVSNAAFIPLSSQVTSKTSVSRRLLLLMYLAC
jgi:hypothetical protein